MTSGERMVWAAEFVRMMAIPDGGYGRLVAVRSATSLVMIMRDLKDSYQLDLEERVMLDDMLGTGENRKPAREPTHEHAFEGDGCDCALCGEGRAHYLHANGGDR